MVLIRATSRFSEQFSVIVNKAPGRRKFNWKATLAECSVGRTRARTQIYHNRL